MATIKTDIKQLEALKIINENLDKIGALNALINAGTNYKISTSANKKLNACLQAEFDEKIIGILLKQKEKYVKEIQKLSAKHQIDLDKSDLELMRFDNNVVSFDNDATEGEDISPDEESDDLLDLSDAVFSSDN